MIVNIDASVYTMNRKGFRGVLKIASKAVKFGIYAVVKDDKAIMLNEKYEDTDLWLVAYQQSKMMKEYSRHLAMTQWTRLCPKLSKWKMK